MTDSLHCPFCDAPLVEEKQDDINQAGDRVSDSWYAHPDLDADCFAAEHEIDTPDHFMLYQMARDYGKDNPALKMAYLAVIIYPPHMRGREFCSNLTSAAAYGNESV